MAATAAGKIRDAINDYRVEHRVDAPVVVVSDELYVALIHEREDLADRRGKIAYLWGRPVVAESAVCYAG